MITIFKQVSPELLDAIRKDAALTFPILEMGWDILDTPLGSIYVRTRVKKAVERMNEDEREVFFKVNAGEINRLIAHPPRSRVLKHNRERLAAARRALDTARFTEKDWTAELAVDGAYRLGYLLCGELGRSATPLSRTISGGGDIGDDLGCGPAHFLTVDDVREVAAALSQISEDDLKTRLDSGAIDWELVSPGDLPGLLRGFTPVRSYYEDAASRGNAMLLFEAW